MKWKQYFKLPFKLDEYGAGYVWDANNQMVLQFANKNVASDELKQQFVGVINNNTKDINIQIPNLSYKEGEFYCGTEYIFQIRSWGYLTSPNCCNLSNEEAAQVQDSLGEYILNLLN